MDYTKLRFWSNWMFIILVSPLYSTSLCSLSSSFHQFVTNPTLEVTLLENNTALNQNIEVGLGETESFYHSLVSTASLGAILGGLVSGFFARLIPYWYLWATAFVVNTLAFIIHSLSYQGWLIVISTLLSGYFVGSIITLSLNYCTMSSEAYVKMRKELGETTDEKASFRLRNYLFSAIGIGHSVGFTISSCAAVVFAQFETVNQFRAIGWFNVVYSVIGLGLLLIMFHGEMRCKKDEQLFQFCSDSEESFAVLPLFITLSLLVLSAIEQVKFSFIVTLFDPVASDSFGMDGRHASYFFLILGPCQAVGSILLIILQRLNISSQIIALFAIITTILGYLTLTDWQTIPYDPCTEFSPYHHPGIVQSLHQSYILFQSSRNARELNTLISPQEKLFTLPKLKGIDLQSNLNIDLGTSTFSLKADLGMNFSCKPTDTCECDRSPLKCLRYTVGVNGTVTSGTGVGREAYQCSSNFKQMSPVTFCVLLSQKDNNPLLDRADIESFLETAMTDIDVLHEKTYQATSSYCIQANVSGHQCHWIPYSDIFKKECEDCQPICRSVRQTLTFPQFIIGNGLLVLSHVLLIVPVTALILNQSPELVQAIVIGCVITVNSVTRGLAPLLLDAAYEGMQKRVFLVTMLLAFIHIPFIIEIIMLYPKLGPKPKTRETDQYRYTSAKLQNYD